ncbi:8-oxo-dGTP diphosphatase [Peribacillus alkalitolerans]|uniref:8-oxo-dGTP diphosphatase n=1 Tax=Peribacillus alkalitolerans TaxID=1550385 RepID=UPI0013D6A9D6|nr:8-oxo-dGTP diphosphatase [Peribacillus alkalitolerans]
MSRNWKDIEHRIYTMCMVQNGDNVLLIKRPTEKGFPGYLAPGGKIDFPESILEGAVREVKEETGLTVTNLIFKGLDEYVNPKDRVRYMVFNYWTNTFHGSLLDNPPEGELHWIPIDQVLHLPLQDWFREKFTLFLEQGTFEIHRVWDTDSDQHVDTKIFRT